MGNAVIAHTALELLLNLAWWCCQLNPSEKAGLLKDKLASGSWDATLRQSEWCSYQPCCAASIASAWRSQLPAPWEKAKEMKYEIDRLKS